MTFDDPAWQRPLMLAAVNDDGAIHHNRAHSGGVLVWILYGGAFRDAASIKDRDVGPVTLTNEAAIRPAEHLRAAAGHLVDCIF